MIYFKSLIKMFSYLFIPRLNSNNLTPSGIVKTLITVPWNRNADKIISILSIKYQTKIFSIKNEITSHNWLGRITL